MLAFKKPLMYKYCDRRQPLCAQDSKKEKAKVKDISFYFRLIFSCPTVLNLKFIPLLKALFSSKARIKLLTTFLLNPDEEYFIRELTRKLDEQINSIRRELDNLKKIGLLKSRVKNRKKYYYTNKDFVIYNELKDILLKSMNNDSELIRNITKLGDIDLLILTGVFVGKEPESEVDLLIVGEIDKERLQKLLSESSKSGKDLRFTAMEKKDLLYRLEMKDKFIRDLIADEKSIVAVNRMKKELERFRY